MIPNSPGMCRDSSLWLASSILRSTGSPVSQWALGEFLVGAGFLPEGGLDPAAAAALLATQAGKRLDLTDGGDLASRVVAAMLRRGYWVAQHPDCVNIVYVEGLGTDGAPNRNAPNEFNDLRLLVHVGEDGKPAVRNAWEATTEPGRYWTEHPMSPGGAARIAFGQYEAWVVGVHRAAYPDGHEALVQTDDVTVYRDLNQDYDRAGDKRHTGTFGINRHWGYDLPKGDLGKSSAGCLVGRTKEGHRHFMESVKADPRFAANRAYRFITTVLPAAALRETSFDPATPHQASYPATPRSRVRPGGPMPEQPSRDWIETALRITGHFEDSADPLGAVTGDFDGMGISVGVLQWNIGSNSLQPLVTRVGRAAVVAAMPHYGVEMWNACTSTIPKGLAIVRGWQVGSTLRGPVRDELKAFARGDAFMGQQVAAAADTAQEALAAARAWAAADGAAGTVTKALFCWFFDLYTQNGGLKGVTYADVRGFMVSNGIDKSDDVICDWLAARGASDAGYRDSLKNAALWRNSVDDQRLPLLVLSYLRAMRARGAYRGDTLNRKATVALGQGWVHMERHDLRNLLAG